MNNYLTCLDIHNSYCQHRNSGKITDALFKHYSAVVTLKKYICTYLYMSLSSDNLTIVNGTFLKSPRYIDQVKWSPWGIHLSIRVPYLGDCNNANEIIDQINIPFQAKRAWIVLIDMDIRNSSHKWTSSSMTTY